MPKCSVTDYMISAQCLPGACQVPARCPPSSWFDGQEAEPKQRGRATWLTRVWSTFGKHVWPHAVGWNLPSTDCFYESSNCCTLKVRLVFGPLGSYLTDYETSVSGSSGLFRQGGEGDPAVARGWWPTAETWTKWAKECARALCLTPT